MTETTITTTTATTTTTSRRRFLGVLAGTAVGAGMFTRPASAQGTDLSSWFEDVSNAEEIVDERGQSKIEITVGAEGNDGNYAFGPAAVRVDPGTAVVWTWTGEGGSHNVVSEDGSFESELESQEGHTFEYAAESKGVYKYVCTPHEAMGMKGALVVGDAPASIGGEASSNGTAGGANATDTTNATNGSETADDGSADTPANGSGTDTGADTPERTFDGWLANTDNYKQVVDKTGTDEVRVAVGAKGNGGDFAFDPPAIRVDPGTMVVWEWVSGDESYSVVDEDGSYRSDASAKEGNLYAVRFDGDGLSKYECPVHSDRGMRGVVIVGEGVVPHLDGTGLAALGGVAALFGAVFYKGVELHNETSSGPTLNRER